MQVLKWIKKWLYGISDEKNMTTLSHEERIQRLREQVRK